MVEVSELSADAERLLPALDALSERDRFLLGLRLIEPPKPSDAEQKSIDAAWKVELQRRLNELRSGSVKGIPVEEMFQRSFERLP
jgi:putative addiction module component (TIGR02574 family)